MTTTPIPCRIQSYDLARGLAVLLMLFINCAAVFPPNPGNATLFTDIIELMERRAAVILVMVSGAGLTLMAKQARACESQDRRICHRAVFLIVSGAILSIFWSGDILHFYGIYLLIGMGFLRQKSRILLSAIAICWMGTVLQQVDAVTFFLEEAQISSLILVYDLFFTGYFPIFPWMAFFLFGMLIARRPIPHPRDLSAITVAGLCVIRLPLISTRVFPTPSPLDGLGVILGASEALPFSIFSGLITGIFALCIGGLLARSRIKDATFPIVLLGRTSLTLYVFHICFFCILSEWTEPRGINPPIVMTTGLFTVGYLVFIVAWSRYVNRGPLEKLMRNFDPKTGSNKPIKTNQPESFLKR